MQGIMRKDFLSVIKNLEKAITNDQLNTINKFQYLYCIFTMKDKMYKFMQMKFLNFLKENKDNKKFSIYNIGNFFLLNNINVKIKFYYIKELSLKENIFLYKHVKIMRKQLYKIQKEKNKIYSFDFDTKTFEDNNKTYTQKILYIYNTQTKRITHFSVDLNILWKPRYREKIYDKEIIKEYAWLFFQIIDLQERK